LKLHHKKIILSNESKIKFHQLTIPCCKKCNTKYLSQLENKVKLIFEKSYKEVSEADRDNLFKWLLKIYGGLWLKSTTLKKDRSKIDSESIIPKTHLKNLLIVFSLIKSIKYDVTFTNFKPYSLFLFDYKQTEDAVPFNFLDNFNFPTVAFAYKKIGIILSIGDGGEIRNRFTRMNTLEYSRVDEFTILENFCRVLTAHSLMNKVYGYISMRGDIASQLRVSKFILPGKEKMDSMRPWDSGVFKKLLITYLTKIGCKVKFDEVNNKIIYSK